MKQNITLALDRQVLRKARAVAAQRGTSVSAMIAQELEKLLATDRAYEQAKVKALGHLRTPFRLGGAILVKRDELHDRKSLR